MSTVEERVRHIVVEQLGVKEEEVSPDSSFVDDLGADSLDTVELVMALEEEFNCEIPTRKPRRLRRCRKRSATSKLTPGNPRAPARRTFREGRASSMMLAAFFVARPSKSPMRRIVVTGLGLVTPVGHTVGEAWKNIVAGRSGVTAIDTFDASGFASRIGAAVRISTSPPT